MKKLILISLIMLCSVMMPKDFWGAVYCVRDGASGNGGDWNNAYGQLPDALERGSTYYIAGGTYGNYTFNDTESSEAYIYIRKAVAADHGVDEGWQDSYGEGSAEFGPLRFDTDYYDFDGMYEYGFKVLGEYRGLTVDLNSNYINIKNTDMDGNFQADASGYHIGGSCNVMNINGSFVIIENCDIHNAADDGVGVYGDNIKLIKNKIHGLHGSGTDGGSGPCYNGHSDGLELQSCSNIEIIGNLVYDINSTAALITGQWSAGNYTRNLTMYNNIFYTPETGICLYIYYVQGARIYNNIFWGRTQGSRYGGLSMGPEATDIYIQNNIILNINYNHLGGVYDPANHHIDYNLFGMIQASEYTANTHDIIGDPLFKDIPMSSDLNEHLNDIVAENFFLQKDSPAIDAGTDQFMASYDVLGIPRPQGDTVDIGAFEYPVDGNIVALIDTDIISGTVPLTVHFNAGPSISTNGQIVRYAWDFENDGIIDAEGVTVVNVFSEAGRFTVSLTVEDISGMRDTAEVIITVLSEESVDPDADDIPEKFNLIIHNNVIDSGKNNQAVIICDLKEAGNLSVEIFDSKGKKIKTVWNGHREAGRAEFPWTGVDSNNRKVGSGVYIVYIEIGSYSETKKIAVIK